MYTVEQQVPSQEVLIEELKQAEKKTKVFQNKDELVGRLSFVILIYFKYDNKPESRQMLFDVVDRFKGQYPIASHFVGRFSRGFVKCSERSYESAKKRLLTLPVERVVEWHLSSGKNGEQAEDYFLGFLADNFLSYLKMHFPMEKVYSAVGRQEIAQWIDYLLTKLEVIHHGYAGLSFRLPYDNDLSTNYEAVVAKQYWGVTADGDSFYTTDWDEGIRSINWQTFIGPAFQEQVTTQANYSQTLSAYPDVKVKHIKDTLVFQAGDLPRLADRDKPLPLSYTVVGHLTRPVQNFNIDYNNGGMSWVETYYWLRRWENANFKAGILDFSGREEVMVPLYGTIL